MATYRIITSKKVGNQDEREVRELIKKTYPDWTVENLTEVNGEWQARLVQAADGPPPFLKKKDEGSPEEEASESPEEETAEEDSGEDDDADDADEKGGDKKEKGDKKKGDPVAEVQAVIDQLNGLLGELGGKAQDLQDAHQEKSDKLDEIADAVGDGSGSAVPEGDGPLPPGLEEDGGPVGPGAAPGKIPGVPHRPGVPSGKPGVRPPLPGAPSAFANRRRTEIAYHSGLDPAGNRLSLTAAAAQLEEQDEFKNYEVVGIKEENGRYVAKLQLK